MAFWGAQVTETKAAIVEVPAGFVLNVCNATSATSNASDSQLSLGLETQQLDGKAWKGAVAHLGGASQPLQVKLDLVFGHKVKFYVAKGSGVVNLTGYFQPGPSFEEEVVNEETPKSDVASAKKSKKRAREDKKNWDEVSSSSDSEDVPEKKVKSTPAPAKEEQKKSKPVETPAKKEEQKKPKQTEAASSNGDAPAGTSQKKKRKKNKHKKQAVNGEAK